MPGFFPEGNLARPGDSAQRSLQKIVDLLQGGGGGGGGGSGLTVLTGSANPNNTVTGTQGQLYSQMPGGKLWQNTNGGTTWI